MEKELINEFEKEVISGTINMISNAFATFEETDCISILPYMDKCVGARIDIIIITKDVSKSKLVSTYFKEALSLLSERVNAEMTINVINAKYFKRLINPVGIEKKAIQILSNSNIIYETDNKYSWLKQKSQELNIEEYENLIEFEPPLKLNRVTKKENSR